MQFKIYILAILSTLLIQNDSKSLNESIYQNHIKSIKGYSAEIENQFEFRQQYIEYIVQLKRRNPNDTIVLIEAHPCRCDGCAADFVEVFSKTKYEEYKLNTDRNKPSKYIAEPIETFKDYKTGQYDFHRDYMGIMVSIRKGKSLKNIASEHGTKSCGDGYTKIYTVLFPNGRLESIDIRNW